MIFLEVKEIKHEKCSRKTFAKIGDSIEMPNLIKVQKDSYDWFVEEGLGEILKDISPIVDYSGNLVLEFLDYYMEDKTKYTVEEAKERDATYSTRLHVKVRLINRETGEIKEQEIYLGDFPLMTDSGTFIINGAERVVVSQLVRSPGCYYATEFDKSGKRIYTSTVMPIRGAWLEYETDGNDIFYARVDRTRKIPVTTLLRALGIVTDEQISELFGDEEKIKEPTETTEAPNKNMDIDVEISEDGSGELQEKIDELTSQLAEANDKYLRLYAEYDNYRKRTTKEKMEAYGDATCRCIAEILPVIDSFERAIEAECTDESYKSGMQMIYTNFIDVLKKIGVTEMEALGNEFDPNLHNAIKKTEDENFGENTICEVFQKGYMFNDRVIRHAVVAVAN